jgi:TIR domain
MGYLFISYSHKDRKYVSLLASRLEQEGFSVWIDERLDYGSEWPLELQQRLDACDALILVMTPRSLASKWVQNELNRAVRKEKPLFPLLLEGDEPWLSVESTQMVDVTGGTLPDDKFFDRLAEVTRQEKGRGKQLPLSSSPASSRPKVNRRLTGILSLVLGLVVLLLLALWAFSRSGWLPSVVTTQSGKPVTALPAEISSTFTTGLSNTSPAAPSGWESFISLLLAWPSTACGPWVIPDQFDPQADPQAFLAWFSSQAGKHALKTLPVIPMSGLGTDLATFSDIRVVNLIPTSLVTGSGWILLGNTLRVTVTAQPVGSHINAVEEAYPCGAASGNPRNFNPVALEQRPFYTLAASTDAADSFTLQPGELEIFSLPLKCSAPGIYAFRFDISYQYRGDSGTFSADSPSDLICPQSVTIWKVLNSKNSNTYDQVVGRTDFTWDGSGYQVSKTETAPTP